MLAYSWEFKGDVATIKLYDSEDGFSKRLLELNLPAYRARISVLTRKGDVSSTFVFSFQSNFEVSGLKLDNVSDTEPLVVELKAKARFVGT